MPDTYLVNIAGRTYRARPTGLSLDYEGELRRLVKVRDLCEDGADTADAEILSRAEFGLVELIPLDDSVAFVGKAATVGGGALTAELRKMAMPMIETAVAAELAKCQAVYDTLDRERATLWQKLRELRDEVPSLPRSQAEAIARFVAECAERGR